MGAQIRGLQVKAFCTSVIWLRLVPEQAVHQGAQVGFRPAEVFALTEGHMFQCVLTAAARSLHTTTFHS